MQPGSGAMRRGRGAAAAAILSLLSRGHPVLAVLLLACLLLVTLAAVRAEAARAVFPILAVDDTRTSISVLNAGNASTAVRVSVHDRAGQLLQHTLVDPALAPGGRLTYPPAGSAWPTGAATIVVESDHP